LNYNEGNTQLPLIITQQIKDKKNLLELTENLFENTQILQLKIKDPHSLALMSIG
jgi:hypothetical protein